MIQFAAPILVVSALPQTIKLYQRKSSEDISIITYFLTWIGIGLILTEAEGGVFIANLSSFIMVTINLYLIIYYRVEAVRNTGKSY
jgi:uncharacterized protein with PQ loop repeat|tara:strand:- start:526 stop:783 length:258 start_codon:yes stop_codon:yes gene_type:complete